MSQEPLSDEPLSDEPLSDYVVHTIESAPEGSKETLEAAQASIGMIPNLYATLAESPAAVAAYASLAAIAQRTDFTQTERHVVWFAINAEHGCVYCMTAHAAAADYDGIAPEVVDAARKAAPQADPKLEALRIFTLQMVRQRGKPTAAQRAAFHAAGYAKRHLLDVVTLIAHKTVMNYAIPTMDPPIDAPFQPFAWSPDEIET